MAGSEAKIERACCVFAKTRGFYVRKFSSTNNRGVPDRLFISPGGVVFFIEFKAPGKLPTALQRREAQLIRKNLIDVHFVDDLQDAKAIISFYEHL